MYSESTSPDTGANVTDDDIKEGTGQFDLSLIWVK